MPFCNITEHKNAFDVRIVTNQESNCNMIRVNLDIFLTDFRTMFLKFFLIVFL